MRFRRQLSLFAILLVPLAVSGNPGDTVLAASEYDIKAALVLTLPKFVYHSGNGSVPSRGDQDSVYRIGVWGPLDWYDSLSEAAQDRSIDGRPVMVEMVGEERLPEEYDVLVVSSRVEESLSMQIPALRRAGVLTITDSKSLFERGCMIRLVLQQKTMAYDINMRSIRSAGLEISSQLVRLARKVQE